MMLIKLKVITSECSSIFGIVGHIDINVTIQDLLYSYMKNCCLTVRVITTGYVNNCFLPGSVMFIYDVYVLLRHQPHSYICLIVENLPKYNQYNHRILHSHVSQQPNN